MLIDIDIIIFRGEVGGLKFFVLINSYRLLLVLGILWIN